MSYGRNTGAFYSTREAGTGVPSLLPNPFRPEEEGWQSFHISTIQYLETARSRVKVRASENQFDGFRSIRSPTSALPTK
jgi:hypothetical protein